MEFYSATKKNEILSFAGKWLEMENIILSEITQAQKAKNHMFSLICGYRLKTNAVILLDTGHTKGRLHTGGTEQGKVSNKYMHGNNTQNLPI
jgi:hypothetical protein